MFGETSRFHFIPLFLISALFIVGQLYSNDYYTEAKFISTLIITFLAIITLVLVSFRTRIESSWYALINNKGFYSFLIAFLIYNFGYLFALYG